MLVMIIGSISIIINLTPKIIKLLKERRKKMPETP
jgi:hypothetical protein